MHQLIEPSVACRRLGHVIRTRLKQPGPGEYEFCVVCTLGYEKALAMFNDESKADDFVRDLRRLEQAEPLRG